MENCKVVADLLPTYCDELTSVETNAYIHEHLSSCENCSRLLEQMQQNRQQNREADDRRTEFKAALARYEHKHKMRVRLLLFACLLLLAVFFVARACSFELAVAASGLNRRQVTVVQEPIKNNEGKLFQILFSQTKNGEAALAYLEKDIFGFWHLSYVATPDETYGVCQTIWSEYLFSNRIGVPEITTVFHVVYAGCNAIDSLQKLPQEELPANVAVMITEYSDHYYIRVITVLADSGSPFNILPLLKEYNLIA